MKNKQVCTECLTYIGGSAMTNSICHGCGKIILNESTNTDKYCKKCAKRESLCKHCGKKI